MPYPTNILIELIKLIRIKHWTKNLFIFLPLFFAGEITSIELFVKAFVVFVAYSFAASSVYIINDLNDAERDRVHPKKKDRPIASGKIKPLTAWITCALLMLASFAISIFITDITFVTLIILYYVVQNILYTFWFKNYAIVDVSIIAVGFILRILVGGCATGIDLSHWIIILTFLLSIFLALGKRRDDIIILQQTNNKLRKSLDGYNLIFIDISMGIAATILIIAYLMYTLSPEIIDRFGKYMYVTTFFVFIGILQYLKLTQVNKNSSSPVKLLLSNLFLQLIIIGWIGSFVFLLYFNN